MTSASFLGLPTELRLKIYEYVFHMDVDCTVIQDIKHVTGSNGTQAILVPQLPQRLSAHIHWLNLQLTCKVTASEMKSYMGEAAFLNNERSRTYILDVEIYNDIMTSPPKRLVKWRGIPCPPAEARALIVHVKPSEKSIPWTEGGPASLARAIYQIMNHLFHRGPQIITKHLLPHHMRIRDLTINVDIGANVERAATGCNTIAERNWRLLVVGWQQISQTGFLMDYMERTKLCGFGKGGGETDIPVEWRKFPSIPGYWSGYGFQWGV